MKKKVIFITEALWVGGIETALLNLLRHMDGAQWDITCMVLRPEVPLATRLPSHCRLLRLDRESDPLRGKPYGFLRLWHLTEPATDPSPLHRVMMFAVPLLKRLEEGLYFRWLRHQLRGQQFDTAVIYSDAVAEAAVRVVAADRFLMAYHHGAMRKAHRDACAYQKCRRIVAVSQAQAERLGQFRPQYAHKITAIPNLTDPEAIRQKAIAPAPDFDPDKTHIVTCGRLAAEKDPLLAVRTCARLVELGHPNVHWWLVGGGPLEPAVAQEIRALGLENHMTVTGMVENPYPYLRRADVYVQTSRFEGCPMAILEALILERSVVSTDNPGSREVLRGGRDGLLCDFTEEALAAGILTQLAAPIRCRRDWDGENQQALSAWQALLQGENDERTTL